MDMRGKTLFMAQFALLLSILAVFCFTPFGQIPMFSGMVASLAAIPIVVAGLALGAKAGALMGGFGGLFSLVIWTFMPPPSLLAFIFTPFYTLGETKVNVGSLLINIVPRVAVGAVAALARIALEKALPRNRLVCFAIGGALGSLANTFGFVLGAWLFFGAQIAKAAEAAASTVLVGIILMNGLPEAAICALAAAALCKPILLLEKRRAKT